MRLEEYYDRQHAIRQQIAAYRMDSSNMQAQIAINEREITRLNTELIALQYEYQKTQED